MNFKEKFSELEKIKNAEDVISIIVTLECLKADLNFQISYLKSGAFDSDIVYNVADNFYFINIVNNNTSLVGQVKNAINKILQHHIDKKEKEYNTHCYKVGEMYKNII